MADRKAGAGRDPGTRSTATEATAGGLQECRRCERLLEARWHRERFIVPRFCPWCGGATEPILGRELDGYRIDSYLAGGGFGLVFLASNIAQPSMKAVVKFLRPETAQTRPDFVELFLEEARLTETISQTSWNVVRVFNVRRHPWPHFFMLTGQSRHTSFRS